MALSRQQVYDGEIMINSLLKYLYTQQRDRRDYDFDDVQALSVITVDIIRFDVDERDMNITETFTDWYETERGQWANRNSIVPLQVVYQFNIPKLKHEYAIRANVRRSSLVEWHLKYT